MNLTSGTFTAPTSGLYFFLFSGTVRCNSTARNYLAILLVLNGNIGVSYTDQKGGSTNDFSIISLQSTLNMNKGDRVWSRIGKSANASLYDSKNHFTRRTFTLILVESLIIP